MDTLLLTCYYDLYGDCYSSSQSPEYSSNMNTQMHIFFSLWIKEEIGLFTWVFWMHQWCPSVGWLADWDRLDSNGLQTGQFEDATEDNQCVTLRQLKMERVGGSHTTLQFVFYPRYITSACY